MDYTQEDADGFTRSAEELALMEQQEMSDDDDDASEEGKSWGRLQESPSYRYDWARPPTIIEYQPHGLDCSDYDNDPPSEDDPASEDEFTAEAKFVARAEDICRKIEAEEISSEDDDPVLTEWGRFHTCSTRGREGSFSRVRQRGRILISSLFNDSSPNVDIQGRAIREALQVMAPLWVERYAEKNAPYMLQAGSALAQRAWVMLTNEATEPCQACLTGPPEQNYNKMWHIITEAFHDNMPSMPWAGIGYLNKTIDSCRVFVPAVNRYQKEWHSSLVSEIPMLARSTSIPEGVWTIIIDYCKPVEKTVEEVSFKLETMMEKKHSDWVDQTANDPYYNLLMGVGAERYHADQLSATYVHTMMHPAVNAAIEIVLE